MCGDGRDRVGTHRALCAALLLLVVVTALPLLVAQASASASAICTHGHATHPAISAADDADDDPVEDCWFGDEVTPPAIVVALQPPVLLTSHIPAIELPHVTPAVDPADHPPRHA